MLDSEPTGAAESAEQEQTRTTPVKATRRRRTTKAAPAADTATPSADTSANATATGGEVTAEPAPPKKRTRARKTAAAAQPSEPAESASATSAQASAPASAEPAAARAAAPPTVTFIAPPEAPAQPPAAGDSTSAAKAETAPKSSGTRKRTPAKAEEATEDDGDSTSETDDGDGDGTSRRRRRGRRGRGRKQSEGDSDATPTEAEEQSAETTEQPSDEQAEEGTSRRRRRRRRGGDDGESGDSETKSSSSAKGAKSTKAAESGKAAKSADSEVQAVKGSTRLEAKRQRRRDGREQTRRRPPVLSESEFLARRESVERSMVVRQVGDRTQIAVLEDKVLVEHYVTKASSTSYAGNVYLGKVQNVLPSMEAAFIDIGKGRNAVLYAGEVNWDLAGLDGRARSIEQALKSGDSVLVQVSKDPIGHKGARLTSQISLPGRYLVYVPGGGMTGISRKLPDTERTRLKGILRKIVPDDAGVIIRTAAEGASEEELTRDVNRLKAQWEVIEARAAKEKSSAPTLLYEEPDLAIRVVRDIFNEDFSELVIAGDEAWETLQQYVEHVAPDLRERLQHHTAESDVFHDLRVDEQLAKALDRKVWLPSGGSLVIDRTEAMTVVDVNTGKFTGQGGNLEETVTRNNLEAAEEIVRQLRLRDIGGIIVIDFIDMVLESNRDLVLRRLTECLGRDRTRHQVAEVTSLGLVQMTRKRVGQGLLEAFSEQCPHCGGRGLIVHSEPVDTKRPAENGGGRSGKDSAKGGSGKESTGESGGDSEGSADKRREGGRRKRSGKSAPAETDAEAPAAEAPAAEAPAAEAPAAEAPAAEVPAAEVPAAAPTETEAAQVQGSPAETASDAASAEQGTAATAEPGTDGADAVAVPGPAHAPTTTASTNGAHRPRRRRAAVREAGPPAS